MTEQSGANELYIDHTGQTSEEQDYGEETTIELHAKEAPVDEIQTETIEPEQQANGVQTASAEELPEEQTKAEANIANNAQTEPQNDKENLNPKAPIESKEQEEQTKLDTEEDKVKNIQSMLNAYPLPTEQTTEMTPLTPSDE